MKRLFAFLIYTLGLTSIAHAAPLSSGQFTQAFAKALQSAQPTLSVVVKGDLELLLKELDGKESTAFLNNAYTQYLRDPKEIDEVLRVYITSFLETRTKPDTIDRTRIVPIIKDRAWLAEIRESVKQRNGEEISENVYDELNEELLVIYAEDSTHNINYFSSKELDKLEVSRGQLRTLAIANLRKLIPEPEIKHGALVSMITAGGDYEASLLLFDDLWASLPKTDGEIVVAIPARDLLVFTGSQNIQGLVKLREFATRFARESAYPLTDTLFVYRSGRFVRFE